MKGLLLFLIYGSAALFTCSLGLVILAIMKGISDA
jgi:hypothetical protein